MNKKIFAIIGAVVLVAVITCLAIVIPMSRNGDDSSSETVAEYKVSFDVNGGSYVKTQTVKEGQTVTEPTPPTRKDYLFDCWVLAGEEYDFSTPVTSSFMLTATWFNTENIYRVTTGVSRNIGNRGSAEIVGEANTSARFTEGTSVTLKAVANEGYTFNGWVDNLTGKTVSTDNVYTFKVRSDVEIRATFLCVITGTDNPTNKAFLEALENVSLDEGCFTITQKAIIDGVTNKNTFYIAFNKAQGLAQITVNTEKLENGNTKNVYGELWIKHTGEEYDYFVYDGENLKELEIPEKFLSIGPMIFEQDTVDPQTREQVILTVYNMFKDTLVEDGNEFSVSADMTDYLKGVKNIINENGNLTLKQIVYSVIKPTWDEALELIKSSDYADEMDKFGDIKEFTIEELIQTLALLSGTLDVQKATEGCKQAYEMIVDAMASLSEFDGKPMDETYRKELIDKFPEIMNLTIDGLLAKLNDSTSSGAVSEIPVTSSLTNAILWAGLYNLNLSDTFAVIIRAMNLSETVWDIQSNVDGTPYLNGRFEVENSVIKSFTSGIIEKDGNAEITVEYKNQCNLVFPESLNNNT